MKARLESVFQRIADTRMAGLPILNPALRVEASELRAWQGEWFGVLITPWFMSLICLPGDSPWPAMPSGSSQSRQLPNGDFLFLAAEDEELGAYLSCSLFSPMGDFADMPSARAVAAEVIQQVFSANTPTITPNLQARLERPIGRRGLFSAWLREPQG